MRKEIEVKARVSDKAALENALSALGCTFSEPIRQEDVIYINFSDHAFDEHVAGTNFLRIRQGNGKALFTVKQPLSDDLDCIEHEVEVDDAAEMKEILLMLGYRQATEVTKNRRKAQYNGYEICLDEVDGLGSFIEVEKITEEEDSEKVQNELFDFLMTLGVKREDRVTRGYDILLYYQTKK